MKEVAYELSQLPDMLTEDQMNDAIKKYYADEDARIKQLERKAKAYDRIISCVQTAAVIVAGLGLGSMIFRVVL